MYNLGYRNEGEREYIVINTDEEIALYQVKMLEEIDHGLLKVQMRNCDGKRELYYDVTGYISLVEKFSKPMDFEAFIKTINKIVDIINLLPGFLLNKDNILLEPKQVFLKDDKIYLIYLPFEYEVNIGYQLKEFVFYLIIRNVKLKTDIRVNTFLDFMQKCKEPIDIYEIKRMLIRLLEEEDCTNCEVEQRNKAFDIEELPTKDITENDKSKVVFLLLQIPLIVIVSLLYLIINRYLDEVFVMGLIIVITLSVDLLLVKYKQGLSNFIWGRLIKENFKNKRKKSKDKQIKKHTEMLFNDKLICTEHSIIEEEDIVNTKLKYKEKDATMLLAASIDKESRILYVLKAVEHEHKDIVVDTDNFIIGRYPAEVDYSHESKAIGRNHLVINGSVIKDLNSRNGTFLNGLRLEGEKSYTIEDGDNLRLANIDYTVEVILEL